MMAICLKTYLIIAPIVEQEQVLRRVIMLEYKFELWRLILYSSFLTIGGANLGALIVIKLFEHKRRQQNIQRMQGRNRYRYVPRNVNQRSRYEVKKGAYYSKIDKTRR